MRKSERSASVVSKSMVQIQLCLYSRIEIVQMEFSIVLKWIHGFCGLRMRHLISLNTWMKSKFSEFQAVTVRNYELAVTCNNIANFQVTTESSRFKHKNFNS